MDFYHLLTDNEKKDLDKLLLHKGDVEIEAAFKKISYPMYQRVINYVIDHYPKENIVVTERLDISLKDKDVVRWTIEEDDLNKFMEEHRHDNFARLVDFLSKSNYPVITKELEGRQYVALNDLNIAFKAAEEKEGASRKSGGQMSFRYKSIIFVNTKTYQIQLSEVRSGFLLRGVMNETPVYEIEVERVNGKGQEILDPVYRILQVLQKTSIPMRISDQKKVLEKYYSLLNTKSLVKRQSINLEIEHLTKFVPNNYGATDKADGERHQMITFNGIMYLIDMAGAVKKLSQTVNKKEEAIFDGELIEIGKHHFFGIFDIIYRNGTSFVEQGNMKTRYQSILDFSKSHLGDNFDYHLNKKVSGYSVHSLEQMYHKTIAEYWKKFKSDMRESELLIRPKLFFFAEGIHPSEIFMICKTIWSLYHQKQLAPYKLDGIMLTPLELPYLINPHPRDYDQTFMEYKWKPANETSIDFYIEFVKDEHGVPVEYIDSESDSDRVYRSVNLMVGDPRGKREIPVPFEINKTPQIAQFYLQDGEVRDINGDIVEDKTVVEMIFQNEGFAPEKSWTILRTRYDKTEQVNTMGTNYGNSFNVANRVWRSINNPISEDDLYQLASETLYSQILKQINERSHKPKGYYSKVSDLAEPMRAFHNWIKLCLISTYGRGKEKVLDLACGRGGDFHNIFANNPKLYVGVDRDIASLFQIKDSALNRYTALKKNGNVPPATFINADVSIPLYSESQKKAKLTVNDKTITLIDKYLSGKIKYDFINCQFAVHYFFRDTDTLAGFLRNVNDHLAVDGYLVLTCFDGHLVERMLNNKDSYTGYYFNTNGAKTKLFEIVKKYENDSDRLGRAINVHNATIGDTHVTEYLVYPEDIIRALTSFPGIELVETDTFLSFFETHRELFLRLGLADIPKIEYLPGTRNFEKIRTYYYSVYDKLEKTSDNMMGKASFEFSCLNRYYVFKRSKKGGSAEANIGIGYLELKDCYRYTKSCITNKKASVIVASEDSVQKKQGNGKEHILIYEKDGEYHPVSYGGNFEMSEDTAHRLIEELRIKK
jgi:hypothetical protein